jgi:hypothetical protein
VAFLPRPRGSGWIVPRRPAAINGRASTTVGHIPEKDAGGFDLPIALGLFLGSGQVALDRPSSFAMVGELALTGETRPVEGVLAMALQAAAKRRCPDRRGALNDFRPRRRTAGTLGRHRPGVPAGAVKGPPADATGQLGRTATGGDGGTG